MTMRLSLLFLSVFSFAWAAKPNVLYIISDDLNTALSGFGHPQCQTPHLDQLAERGVKFERMYCQYPICGASRNSIMSGLYPYTNGTLGNTGTLRGSMPDVVTLSQMFRNNGYYAARVSKIYHMGIPSEIMAGTAQRDDADSWDEAINVKAAELNTPGESTNWTPKFEGSQRFQGIIGAEDNAIYADGLAADQAIRLLDKLKDRPFFLAVGMVRPHVPLVAPGRSFECYDRDAMQPPLVPEDDLDDVPKVIRGYKANRGTYGVTPELHKGLLQAYYASVTYMDEQVGRVLQALEDKGLAETTIVVFTSDHGYLLGEHHKFQKQHLFEESTRVPFIVSVPWLKDQHGQGTTRLTELIDLYPTLADLAGLEAPGVIQGKSLTPLLRDPASPDWTRHDVLTVSRSGGESLRNDKWRYIHWNLGESGAELYDLTRDPGEFTNLIHDPEYADIAESMRLQLVARSEAAGLTPELATRLKKRRN